MLEYSPQSPDVYFSARALEAARTAGSVALHSNLDELQGLVDLANRHIPRSDLPSAKDLTFVAMRQSRFSLGGEQRLHQVGDGFPLYRPDQLGAAAPDAAAAIEDLAATHRRVVEFRPWEWSGSLTSAIAARLLGPAPGEAREVASAQAWGRQITGLGSRETDELINLASWRFPNAMVLGRQSQDTR
jgi:hypothetical protein